MTDLLMSNFTADQLHPLMRTWLRKAFELEASDLHLIDQYPPSVRVHGKLVEIATDPLCEKILLESLPPIASEQLLAQLQLSKNADLATSVAFDDSKYRLRINLFLANGTVGACVRVIPDRIPDFAWASFPEDLALKICSFPNGLVLFTGITGSGKSTSLAMIINWMNQQGGNRILTIEDPIEYQFPFQSKSVVTQRELGSDVASFADGLKYGLRQDPDIILVGEIRDAETAKMALSAAETGHLVLSTLHTRDAKGAISRYADMFPQNVQNEVRSQLATMLRAVICQRLLDSSLPGEKQELALEIMFNNSAISNAIRIGKLESIDNYILTGRNEGMITLDESIKRLVASGLVLKESAARLLIDR